MQLRYHVAVALMYASVYSSDLAPSLGTSIRHGYRPKKKDKEKKSWIKICYAKIELKAGVVIVISDNMGVPVSWHSGNESN